MGVRVHKAVGWGLLDAMPSLEDTIQEATLADVLLWNQEHLGLLEKTLETRPCRGLLGDTNLSIQTQLNWEFAPSIFDLTQEVFSNIRYSVFRSEHPETPYPIVFLPPGLKRYHRYDDTLDWIEESLLHKQEDRHIFFGPESDYAPGLYPYLSGFPPISVAAILTFIGKPEWWPRLREMFLVYWS